MNDLSGTGMNDIDAQARPRPTAAGGEQRSRISLEAIAYYWPRQKVFDFYDRVAALPVDVVYLGETICSRRHELRLDDWIEVATWLADAGKEAVFSSQALIESESDLKALRRLIDAAADDPRLSVEANDFGAVRLLAERGLKFVAGPSLNVFNPETLGMLAELGATRWVMPAEMSGAMLTALLRQRPQGITTEALVWGRLPLAMSARCFTARHFRLQKDSCEFKCLDFADGLPLATREGAPFLVLNGVQTQSAKIYNLLRDLDELRQTGVDVFRISPQAEGLPEVIAAFRRQLNAPATPPELWPNAGRDGSCNGFWHGRPGLELID